MTVLDELFLTMTHNSEAFQVWCECFHMTPHY
jgi:hypothetical protein